MKNVLVTGGAGFIGSNLTRELLKIGISVRIVDDLSSGTRENIPEGVRFLEADLSEISNEDLCAFMKGVDTVFHLAAKARVQPSIEDPVTFNRANVDSTLSVLVAARDTGVKRFVYSASSSCYGDTKVVPTPESESKNPVSPYGLQKYIGEQYCKLFSKLYGLDTVSLRYFNVYGEGMRHDGAYSLVLSVWKYQYEKGLPLTITNDGNQRRDFTHVRDVVQANIKSALHSRPLAGESFNVGNGKSYSMNEVVEMIGGKYMYGEERVEPFETLADNSKIKDVLGWKPTGSLEEYIEKNFK